MDPQVGASFIPKKPLTGSVSRSRAGGFGIVILVALLLFIASLVSAGAAFLYERFLTASISSKNHSLELAQSAYQPGAIEDLSRLDSRINQARTVLQKHIAPSAIFAFLSTQTLEKVRFTNFDYTINTDGSASVTLKGEGNSFSTIALQSDQLGASKILNDIIFSDIAIDPLTSKVTFSVKANLDPSLILYSKTLLQNPADAGTDAAPSTPTP